MSKVAQTRLGLLVRIRTGKLDANANDPDGEYPFFTCSKTPLRISSYSYDCECVLVAGNGDLNVKYYEGKFDAYQRTYIIESLDSKVLNSKYLFRFLSEYIEELRRGSVGGVIKFIKLGHLTGAPIPVPPLAEQERIVKLLDEADELRKLRAQADRRTAALIFALFHEMFGKETEGSTKSLGEVCLKITDGVHITPTYVTNGIPFLRVTDIQEEEINWNDVKFISQNEYDQITRRVKPEQGDILYSKNGTIGIAKEITWERPFAHFVSLALLKPNREILNPTFLTVWLNTPAALRQAVGYSKKGTVTNLHLIEIKKMRLPCPPMETQISFVRRVSEIRALEAEQSASRKRLDDLFQCLLHRAFNGEL